MPPQRSAVHAAARRATALALNDDDVLVSAGDDGSLKFWDYGTGYSFQEAQSRVRRHPITACGLIVLCLSILLRLRQRLNQRRLGGAPGVQALGDSFAAVTLNGAWQGGGGAGRH